MIIPRRYADIQPGEFSHVFKLQRQQFNTDTIIEWEKTFADYIGVNHAIAIGSGRLAMILILKSFNFEHGSEIIIPAYTLKDLIPLIQSLHLKPIPADIDKDTFNITPESILNKITNKTKAILALHIFGNPCRIDKIKEIADSHNLKLIEDCAHSAGSQFAGKMTGSFGNAGFFSFETIKPINTYGGGMIVSDDNELIENIRLNIQSLLPPSGILGKVKSAYIERLMFFTSMAYFPLRFLASEKWSKRMNALYRIFHHAPKQARQYSSVQASLGLDKIKTLNKRVGNRRKKAYYLRSLLPDNIHAQVVLEDSIPNYYFFVALLPKPAENLRKNLLKYGFDAGVKNEIADNCAQILKINECPNVEYVYKNAIHLPIHENIKKENIEHLAKIIKEQYS